MWFNSVFLKRKLRRKSIQRFYLHWVAPFLSIKLFNFGISTEWVYPILHNELHMENLCLIWVWRLLTKELKQHRMRTLEDFPSVWEDSNDFSRVCKHGRNLDSPLYTGNKNSSPNSEMHEVNWLRWSRNTFHPLEKWWRQFFGTRKKSSSLITLKRENYYWRILRSTFG